MTADIEARALALHQTRKDNLASRDRRSAATMTFTGTEREFCMAEAANAIAEEAYQAERQTAEDRWYADQLAAMTDEQIAYRIRQIDEEVANLPYRALTVNIADRGAGLRDERRRLVTEHTARVAAPKIDERPLVAAVADALGVPALEAAE